MQLPGALLVSYRTVGAADVGVRLSTLRREIAADRKLLASVEKKALAPRSLPTPNEVVTIVAELEGRLRADPTRGREELRQYFADGRIELVPQPGRFYVARSKFLPLVPLTQTPSEAQGLGGRHMIPRIPASSCAGAI
jgi:hypothetical protein